MAEKEGTARELITALPWCQARKSLFGGGLTGTGASNTTPASRLIADFRFFFLKTQKSFAFWVFCC
jgi:hypothetical protein